MNTQIYNTLVSNKLIENVREITFEDIKSVITDKVKYKNLEINSKKVFLFKFLYRVGKEKVVGFMSVPKTINIKKKNKTIISLRGGNRDFGAIKFGYFFNKDSYFSWFSVDQKYITISTQYRGNSGGTGVDEFGGKDLNDVKILYRIISKLDFCDIEKIGIFGWSRGAQMIYQLLKTEKWIKTAICIAGPTDHIRMIKENFREEWKEHLIKMFGGSTSETKKRSALYWTNKIKQIPILIIHGTKDESVNVQDSVDIHKLLPKSKLILFKNDDHSLSLNKDKVKKIVIGWFRKEL